MKWSEILVFSNIFFSFIFTTSKTIDVAKTIVPSHRTPRYNIFPAHYFTKINFNFSTFFNKEGSGSKYVNSIINMAKLVSSGKEIGFTILPYSLDTPVQEELIANPSYYMHGCIIHSKETGEYKFNYVETTGLTEAKNHWSLAIIKEFPYCEQQNSWIVYKCSPRVTALEFGKLLTNFHETLHIYNWDIWSVEGKNSKVAVITSWEIF